MFSLPDIYAARERTAPYVRRTPLIRNDTLSRELGTNVYLKLEMFQKTGSFKPRGAFNQILHLDETARTRGVVAVSGGNFAQAVAYAGQALGLQTLIYMPAYTPANYLAATRGYGAQVELTADISAAFAAAEERRAEGYGVVHPYDNPHQMAGNGGVGLEILEDAPQATDVVISVGGGGLLAGNLVALKELRPSLRVWGVETEGAETLAAAMRAGRVVAITPRSLARTLGAPVIAETALRLAQEHLEDHIVVSDEEAIEAQRFLLERAKVLTELAASCTLAAARRAAGRFGPEDHVVLLLCGGNESLENMAGYRAGVS